MGFGEHSFFEQSALDFREFEVVVTVDEDVSHLHLVLFVDIYVEYDLVFLSHVVSLHDVDFGVLVAFVVKVFLCEYLCAVNHVWSNLRPLHDAEFRLHVLTFRLLDAVVVDGAYSRAQREVEAEVNLRTDEGVCRDCHL